MDKLHKKIQVNICYVALGQTVGKHVGHKYLFVHDLGAVDVGVTLLQTIKLNLGYKDKECQFLVQIQRQSKWFTLDCL